MNKTEKDGGAEITQSVEQGNGGGFFASVMDIFVDPNKVFGRIDRGIEWWKPFVLTAAVILIITWLNIPVQKQIISLNERGLTEEQLEMAFENVDRFSLVGVILAPIGILALYLVVAFIVNLGANLLSGKSDYRKSLALVSFAGLISIVEQILIMLINRLKGVENISSAEEAREPISLAALFPDLEGFWEVFLESLSVFSIWYYIILALGISAIFRVDIKKSYIPVVILWIISLGFLYLSKMFGGG